MWRFCDLAKLAELHGVMARDGADRACLFPSVIPLSLMLLSGLSQSSETFALRLATRYGLNSLLSLRQSWEMFASTVQMLSSLPNGCTKADRLSPTVQRQYNCDESKPAATNCDSPAYMRRHQQFTLDCRVIWGQPQLPILLILKTATNPT